MGSVRPSPHTRKTQTNSHRLEATFGVIAAAAPSVRPLLGHNVMSSNRSKSRDKSGSLPLSSMRYAKNSRAGRGESVMLETRDEFGEPMITSDADSQSQLWAHDDRGIVKTISVNVTDEIQSGEKSDSKSEESQDGYV